MAALIKSIEIVSKHIKQNITKYTVANMMNPVIRDNSGIKKIDWKIAGTNPVTAEKQIEVQIEFYFDSKLINFIALLVLTSLLINS